METASPGRGLCTALLHVAAIVLSGAAVTCCGGVTGALGVAVWLLWFWAACGLQRQRCAHAVYRCCSATLALLCLWLVAAQILDLVTRIEWAATVGVPSLRARPARAVLCFVAASIGCVLAAAATCTVRPYRVHTAAVRQRLHAKRLLALLLHAAILAAALMQVTTFGAGYLILLCVSLLHWAHAAAPHDAGLMLRPAVLRGIQVYSGVTITLGFMAQITLHEQASSVCDAQQAALPLGYICSFTSTAGWRYYLVYVGTLLAFLTSTQLHAWYVEEFAWHGHAAHRPLTALSAGDHDSVQRLELPHQGDDTNNTVQASQHVMQQRGMLARLRRFALIRYASGAGLGIAALAVLAWTTTFPSLLTLAMLLWVLLLALQHTDATSYVTAPPSVLACMCYIPLVAVLQYAAAIYALWYAPACFDPGDSRFDAAAFALDAVQALYPDVVRFIGLSAYSEPCGQAAFSIVVMCTLAVYNKATLALRMMMDLDTAVAHNAALARAATAASRNASDSATRSHPHSLSRGSSMSSVLSASVASADGIRIKQEELHRFLARVVTACSRLTDAAYTLSLGYAANVTLLVLYVLALSHVDLLHAGYLVFFAVFAATPTIRMHWWRTLIRYACVCVVVMFCWDSASWALRSARPYIATDIPPWIIGSDIVNPAVDLWHSSYVSNLVILVFATLQAPQYDQELSGAYHVTLLRVYAKYPFVRDWQHAVTDAQVQYGAWVLYVVIFAVALIPPINVLDGTTMLLVGACMAGHLVRGIDSSARDPVMMSRLAAWMSTIGALQAAFLGVRYLYQFDAVETLVKGILSPLSQVIAVDEWGLERYVDQSYAGNVYLYLLDSVTLMILAILQARALLAGVSRRLEGAGNDDHELHDVEGAELEDSAAAMPLLTYNRVSIQNRARDGDSADSAAVHLHAPGLGDASLAVWAGTVVAIFLIASGTSALTGLGFGATCVLAVCLLLLVLVEFKWHGMPPHSRQGCGGPVVRRMAHNAVRLLRRIAFYHSSKLTLLVVVTVALTQVDCIGILYLTLAILLTTLLGCTRESWAYLCRRSRAAVQRSVADQDDVYVPLSPGPGGRSPAVQAVAQPSTDVAFFHVWFPFLVVALVVSTIKYAFQFSFFGGSVEAHWYTGGTAAAEWWGLYRVDHLSRDPPAAARPVTYASMWALLGPQLWIMLACVLQRWSHDFHDAVMREERETRATALLDGSAAALAVDVILPLHASVVPASSPTAVVSPLRMRSPTRTGEIEAAARTLVPSASISRGATVSAAADPHALDQMELTQPPLGRGLDEDTRAEIMCMYPFAALYFGHAEPPTPAAHVLFPRSTVTVSLGMNKLLRKYTLSLLSDCTCAALAVASLSLCNVWSLLLLVFVAALLNPWSSASLHRRYAQHVVWPLLQLFLIVVLLLHYSAAVGFHPSITFYRTVWPWTASAAVLNFFGLRLRDPFAPVGTVPAYTLTLMPAFVALLLSALMSREWGLRAAARNDRAEHAAGIAVQAKRADEGSAPATILVPQPLATLPTTSFRCDWDQLQVFVASYAHNVVLLCTFIVAASQMDVGLLQAGYMAFAVAWLHSPKSLLARGNQLFGYLRVYNLVVITGLIVYAMPYISPPSACASDTDPSASLCLTWQAILGVRKMTAVPIPDAAGCAPAASANVTVSTFPTVMAPLCTSPFDVGSGMVPSVVIFILGIAQAYVFDSSAFSFVRADEQHRETLAATRRLLSQRLEAENAARGKVEASGKLRLFRARLSRLVQKIVVWDKLSLAVTRNALLAHAVDLHDAQPGLAALLEVLPPPPPQSPTAVRTSATSVRLQWSPPAVLHNEVSYVVGTARMQAEAWFRDYFTVLRTARGVTHAVVDGLEPDTDYAFRVAARTRAGVSEYVEVELSSTSSEMQAGALEDIETSPEYDTGVDTDTTANGTPIAHLRANQHSAEARIQQEAEEDDGAGSYVMAGQDDIQGCCGCERGCGGWVSWVWSMLEDSLLRTVDRLQFPHPVASFLRAVDASAAPARSERTAEDAALLDVDWDWVDVRLQQRAVTRVMFVLYVGMLAAITHSQILVGVAIIVDAVVSASAVTTVLAVFFFMCLMIEFPRPSARQWNACIVYVTSVVVVKFVFQLPLFCVYTDASEQWMPAFYYDCTPASIDYDTALKYVQPIAVVGITKLTADYGGSGYLTGVALDLTVLVALLIHRHALKVKGLWRTRSKADVPFLDSLARALSVQASDDEGGAVAAGDAAAADITLNEDASPDEDAAPAAKVASPRTSSLQFPWCFHVCGPSSRRPHPAYMHHTSSFAAVARACVPYGVYMFFLRTLAPAVAAPRKRGRDYYLPTFLLQFLMLLVIILGYSTLTAPSGFGSENLSQQLQYNQFSGEMVLAALAQITAMVADRTAYLLRSSLLKAFIHFIAVLVVHISVFFVLPFQTELPFTQNPTAVIFYLLWCAYFAVGATQLHDGFPSTPPSDSLKSGGYNAPMPLVFNIYLSIPFLHELRQILDWACSRTSLDVYQWMKLEAIHVDLFMSQCDKVARSRDPDTQAGRKPQGWAYKCTCGVLLFLALLLVILLPALIFSTLNPALTFNSVFAASASVSVRAATGSYQLFASDHSVAIYTAANATGQPDFFNQLRVNASVFGNPSPIRPDWGPLAQQSVMTTFPDDSWSISPPGVAALLSLLQAAANSTSVASVSTVYIDLAVSFLRPQPAGFTTITSTYSQALTPASCALLAAAIQTALAPVNSTAAFTVQAAGVSVLATAPARQPLDSTVGDPLIVTGLYPLVMRLPATSTCVTLGSVARSVSIQLHRGNNSAPSVNAVGAATLSAFSYADAPLWWTVKVAPEDPFRWSTSTGLVFNTISDKVAPSFLVASLGSYSVLAVYVTVVLAIARLVRSGFGSPTHRIMFEEMPDATELLELCEGVRIAQQSGVIAATAAASGDVSAAAGDVTSSLLPQAAFAAPTEEHDTPTTAPRASASAVAGTDAGLVAERQLYNTLIRVMRSPELLLRLTQRKDE